MNAPLPSLAMARELGGFLGRPRPPWEGSYLRRAAKVASQQLLKYCELDGSTSKCMLAAVVPEMFILPLGQVRCRCQ